MSEAGSKRPVESDDEKVSLFNQRKKNKFMACTG